MPTSPVPHEALFFRRLWKEKLWGGDRLEVFLDEKSPGNGAIGETWEISDYPGSETVVRGGGCDGLSLRQLMEDHGGFLLGDSRAGHGGRYPLLVKFIEARQDLSVQVHPPDGYGAQESAGKSEVWHVLAADAGASVACGLRPGTDPRRFGEEAADARVLAHLHRVPVRAGDTVFVPPGQPHSIGAGVLLCEIQQTSDVTFRLYDWDRRDRQGHARPLHVKEALEVVNFELPPGETVAAATVREGVERLGSTPWFELRRLTIAARARLPLEGRSRVHVVVDGTGALEDPGGARPLRRGDAYLVPGGLRKLSVVPEGDPLVVLEGVAR